MIGTTVEQSKKLVEIGISTDTADMHYSTWTIIDGEWILSPNYNDTIEELQEEYGNQIIPAWSLTALLKLIPMPTLSTINYRFCCETSEFSSKYYDEPVDAAFEMICWLKENKKI